MVTGCDAAGAAAGGAALVGVAGLLVFAVGAVSAEAVSIDTRDATETAAARTRLRVMKLTAILRWGVPERADILRG